MKIQALIVYTLKYHMQNSCSCLKTSRKGKKLVVFAFQISVNGMQLTAYIVNSEFFFENNTHFNMP